MRCRARCAVKLLLSMITAIAKNVHIAAGCSAQIMNVQIKH